MHCIVTFTKSFAQILSRDFGFLQNCGQTERSSENHYPNPNIGLHPNPNPDPNPNLNPNPNPSRTEIETFTGWARDQNSFLPITTQRSNFTLRHVGWLLISKQKYVGSNSDNVVKCSEVVPLALIRSLWTLKIWIFMILQIKLFFDADSESPHMTLGKNATLKSYRRKAAFTWSRDQYSAKREKRFDFSVRLGLGMD